MAQCKKPISLKGVRFGCSQCLPCRINKRREWTLRIMLEAKNHEENCFVTLTYSPEHLPEGGTLCPEHVQKWLKRVRKTLGEKRPIRYYLVGEYGDVSQRPHYHLAIFGAGTDCAGIFDDKWNYGFSYTGTLTFESAQYVAGYVTKKLTKKDDPRLNGKYPEFARMSLKPGIGAGASDVLAELLQTPNGRFLLSNYADAPPVFNTQGKSWPVGRYIRDRVRDLLGWTKTQLTERKIPLEIDEKRQQKAHVQGMRNAEKFAHAEKVSENPWDYLEKQRAQKALTVEFKHNLNNRKKL